MSNNVKSVEFANADLPPVQLGADGAAMVGQIERAARSFSSAVEIFELRELQDKKFAVIGQRNL